MVKGKRKYALPVYCVGVVWILWALIWKLYLPIHYVWAALASIVVYYLAEMICASRARKASEAERQDDEA